MRLVFFLLAVATLCVPLLAQSTGADLTGQVVDPDGAAVAGARVVATATATTFATRALAGADGVFTLTNLKPGEYSIEVEASGFAAAVYDGVVLRTGARQRLDVKLAVVTAKKSLDVSADVGVLQTDSADLQHSVSQDTIVALPLNGRTFVQLVTLAPGVALPQGTLLPRINGGRPRTNEYLFDGISALQPEPGQVVFFPIIDAIQEFNVESSAVSAEFGRFNGGVVNLTTRAGANTVHGSAFEFVRNEALNARNYFAPAGSAKPLFRRNQYGVTVGGPIRRGRTFFFTDYQGTRQSIGTIRTSTVPTLLQRQGIFTEAIAGKVPVIFDPATTKQLSSTFTRTAFPGNTIPGYRIDPAAAILLNHYPKPTQAGTANNFTQVGNDDDHQHQADVRLDHRFAESHQMFGRYSYFHDIEQPVTPLPEGSGNITSGAIALTANVGQQVVGGYSHVFGSLLNELRVGYTRRSARTSGTTLDGTPADSLKLPGLPGNAAFADALPQFTIAGLQQIGSPSNAFSRFKTDVTEVVDTASRQLGRHTVRFGLDFRWERLDVLQPPNPTGVFAFSQLFTDQPGVTGTGNAVASFLLGQVQQFSVDLQNKVIRPRARIEEYFVQDNWKATRRLSVNAGVRYTLNFSSTEADNQGAVFNLQTQKLDYLGQNGFSRSARELHWGDFGPRVGLAYLLTDKTVIRAGYGVVWIEQTGITTPFTVPQFPFLQTVTQRTLDNIVPAFVLSNGPTVAPLPLTADAGLGQGVFAVDRQLGSGYAQQWNLAVERELWSGLSLQTTYTGSHITHVGVPDVNINQLTPQQLEQGNALLQRVSNPFFGAVPRSSSIGDPTIPVAQLMKPFPRFTTVALFRDNTGSTVYHAGEIRLQQKLSHGVTFSASYTRSKLIDSASSVFNAAVLTGPVANFPVADSFNSRRERDSSTGDMPNVFAASYAWNLPAGKGHRFAPSGLAGALLGGWQLAGIVTSQSGMPVAITQVTNFNSFAGYGVQRPNVIADPQLSPDQRSPAKFFNTAAFQVAPQFTLGNSSRNPVRGPAYRNGDLAFIKHSRIRERADLEIRAEIFNLTNTPALAQPNGTLGSSAFGTINSTATDPRVIQFGIKFNY